MKKPRLLAMFGSVCLVLALLVTLTGGLLPSIAKKSQDELPPGIEKKIEEAVEAEITFADGVPIPPGVRPVIILQGSDYDLGYQYAQQVIQIFGPWFLEDWQREFTDEQILALKANQWVIKDEAPEFIDMCRGIADGANDAGVDLSYEEALAQFAPTVYPGDEPPGSEDDELPPEDCSGFAAWGSATEDGSLICGGSWDGSIRCSATVIVFPETGNNFIMSNLRSSTVHPGMNDKGLAYYHHSAANQILIKSPEDYTYGVEQGVSFWHTLRFADDAEEAVAMQLAYTGGDGKMTGAWADVGGDAFAIECKDPFVVIREAGDCGEDDFLYSSNVALAYELGEYLTGETGHGVGWPVVYFEHGGWQMDDVNSVRRNLMMWNALHNYHGSVDLEFAKMMYRIPSPAPDYPTLEEAEIEMWETYSEGWDTYIGGLANSQVSVLKPDDGNNGLFFTSMRVSRQAEPLTAGYHFYPVAATFTFYELQLAANPSAVVSAARKQGQYSLYYANKELRKMNYTDVGYAPLDEIFDKAATEWFKGDYYRGLARSTSGNESLYNFNKALRAYARCQAYANQVYEALVGAADDPTDLGLDEWFGGWGEWEVALNGNP